MPEIRLPKKFVRVLLPLSLVVSLFLLAGGFYFWRQGLTLSNFTATKEEGEVSGAAKAAALPPEVPLFESATLISTSQTESGVQFAFETGDSLSRVYNFYERQLLGNGWKKARETSQDDGVYLLYTRGAQIIELNLSQETKTRKTVGIVYASFN